MHIDSVVFLVLEAVLTMRWRVTPRLMPCAVFVVWRLPQELGIQVGLPSGIIVKLQSRYQPKLSASQALTRADPFPDSLGCNHALVPLWILARDLSQLLSGKSLSGDVDNMETCSNQREKRKVSKKEASLLWPNLMWQHFCSTLPALIKSLSLDHFPREEITPRKNAGRPFCGTGYRLPTVESLKMSLKAFKIQITWAKSSKLETSVITSLKWSGKSCKLQKN